MNKIKIIDNVLPKEVFEFVSEYIQQEPVWSLNMYDKKLDIELLAEYCMIQTKI